MSASARRGVAYIQPPTLKPAVRLAERATAARARHSAFVALLGYTVGYSSGTPLGTRRGAAAGAIGAHPTVGHTAVQLLTRGLVSESGHCFFPEVVRIGDSNHRCERHPVRSGTAIPQRHGNPTAAR